MTGQMELLILVSIPLVGLLLIISAIFRLRKKLSQNEKPTAKTYVNELGGYGVLGVLLIVVGAGVGGAKLLGTKTVDSPPQQTGEQGKGSAETLLKDSGEPSVGNATDLVYLEANRLRLAGKQPEAIQAFDQAIENSPTLAEAYLGRGQSYAASGKLDSAIADFDKAIELNGQLADAYHERGFAYGNLGRFDRALKDFGRAIRLDAGEESRKSELAAAHANRGFVHFRLGNHQEAKGDYDKALELDPALAMARYHRAVYNKHIGDSKSALHDLTETINLQPNHVGALHLRAFIQATSAEASLRNGKQAVKDASTVCELTDWNDAGMIAALAAAYAEAGDFEKARKHKDQAIAAATPQRTDSIRSLLEPIANGQPVRVD